MKMTTAARTAPESAVSTWFHPAHSISKAVANQTIPAI